MRILVVTSTGKAGPHVMRDFAESFRDAGHVVDVFDVSAIRGETPAKRFINLVTAAVDKLNAFAPDMAIGYGANACVIYADENNKPVDLFTSLGMPTVCVFYDSPLEDSIFYNIEKIDNPKLHYYLVWDGFYVDDMKKLGFEKVYYMPIAANTDRFRKLDFNSEDARKYGADVSFVGSRTPKRERVLRELADFDLAVWGYDWENASDEKLRKLARGVADNETELVKIYNYSKININITVDQGVSSLNMRVFDCLASGGFLISDYKQDFDSLFAPGEAVTFRELSELPRMVGHYLENDEERITIAEKGRLRVAADHSYSKRAELIMSLLEKDGVFARPRWWEGMAVKNAAMEHALAEAVV